MLSYSYDVQNSNSHLASHTVAPQITGMHDTIFIARQHTDAVLTRDIDIAILSVRLSVRDVPVSDENGLT